MSVLASKENEISPSRDLNSDQNVSINNPQGQRNYL
jgi:hypothetical protein